MKRIAVLTSGGDAPGVNAAIAFGLLTFIGWNFFSAQGFVFALTLPITVVVIACPDALGLAIPTAVMVGTGLRAERHSLQERDRAMGTKIAPRLHNIFTAP